MSVGVPPTQKRIDEEILVPPGVRELASLASADIQDAMAVLGGVGLHPATRYYFRRAKILLHYAPRIRNVRWRRLFLAWSIHLLRRGRARMVFE